MQQNNKFLKAVNRSCIVKNQEELQNLLNDKSIKYIYDKIEIPQIEDPNKRRVIEKMNNYFFECGCSLGAIFLLGGLLVANCLLIFYYSSWSFLSFIITILIALIGGLLGKFLGLIYAKISLKRCINNLKPYITQ